LTAGAEPTALEGITELYSRYAFAMDESAADALADCFVEDGAFRVSGMKACVGRQEIQAHVVRTVERRPRHQYSNLWIRAISDDVAHCSAYFLLIDAETGENAAYGTYDDEAVRCPDGFWRWRDRRVQFEWTSKRYDLLGRATTELLPPRSA
jgi:uncharacterized protein (TIGR02246 family)